MWCAARKFVKPPAIQRVYSRCCSHSLVFRCRVHCYADDLQLYVHCRADKSVTAIAQLLACIQAIDRWMGSNRLKMNPDKTQFIWLGSRQQLSAINVTPLHLHDSTVIMPSTPVRNLGAVFDCEMTMLHHINSVTRSCFYYLRQLRTVRRALTHDSAKMLAHAFVSSRVDYCNSILFGASAHVLRKMQAVLNATARLVCGLGPFDHITPAMRDDLHWLPVRQRIEYKIALLVYKCLHGAAPVYLSDYCVVITETDKRHNLRSISRGDLLQPRTRTHRLSPRSFRYSGPSVWNSLPATIRDNSLTLGQFKQHLKHHLFCAAYDIV